MAVANPQIEIPRDVLASTRMSLEEMRTELAVHLYESGKLSVGKARELAGMSLWQFRQLLGSRRIGPHFGIEDLEEDLATVRSLDDAG